jgi:signal transduction histidine kinase
VNASEQPSSSSSTTFFNHLNLYHLFQHVPTPMCILRGSDLVYEFVNNAYLQLLNKASSQLIGQPLPLVIPLLDSQTVGMLHEAMANKQTISFTERPIDLDWEQTGVLYRKYINATYQPLFNEQDDTTVTGVLVLMQDVTKSVRDQMRYKILTDISHLLTSLHNEQGMLQAVADILVPAAAQMCTIDLVQDDDSVICVAAQGDDETQYLGQIVSAEQLRHPAFDIVFNEQRCRQVEPDDQEYLPYLQSIRNITATRLIIYPIIHNDVVLGLLTLGQRDSTTVWDKDDLELFEDISEQIALCVANIRSYAAEQKARNISEQSEQTLMAVIESIPEGLYIYFDQDNIICNSAVVELMGYSSAAELNADYGSWTQRLNLRDVDTGEQLAEHEQPFFMALNGHTSSRDVLFYQPQLQEERRIRFFAAPIYHHNKLIGALELSSDITDLWVAEQQRLAFERSMLETQRLESLGVLAGGIAHDFNNLLTGILGSVETLQHDLPKPFKEHPALDQIMLTSLRAAELTRQMLAYAGKGKVKTDVLDLNKLINNVQVMVEAGIPKTTSMSVRLGPSLPLIEGDISQLRQVFLNILLNSVESLPNDTGHIQVSTRYGKLNSQELNNIVIGNADPEQKMVICTISDNGVGMDEKTKRHMFEPFFTTKFTGRGLGLSAVSGVMRLSKGILSLQSTPNKGTSISIGFPISELADQNKPSNKTSKKSDSTHDHNQTTILVIEDEAVVLKITLQALQRLGYKTLSAASGQSGVDTYFAHAETIDLVLLDLTMPDLQGNEVAALIWERNPDAKIIAMSGYTSESINEAFPPNKLLGFLAKPFRVQKLQELLNQVL